MINWLKNIFNVCLTVAAVLILIGFGCYFTKTTFNPVIIGFFLAGLWALKRIVPKESIKSLVYYATVYVVVAGTAYIYGENTLLGMYKDWAVLSGTHLGFVRIFMPLIVLTAGSIFLSATATSKTFTRGIVIICTGLAVLGLLLYGLVGALDKFLLVKKTETVEGLDRDRINTLRGLGNYALIINGNAKVYNEIKQGGIYVYPAATEKIEVGKKYPVYDLNKIGEDGRQKLIQIWMPDANGDYNNNSVIRWVRIDDIYITKKEKSPYPPLGTSKDFKFTRKGEYRDVEFQYARKLTITVTGAPARLILGGGASMDFPSGTHTYEVWAGKIMKFKSLGRTRVQFKERG